LARERERELIDRVEIGALLAIDLDVDEELVHERCRLGILEALMGHDVTPVTGGIADREQDRLVLFARARQRGLAPGPPMDRVVLVLQEVGAGFLAEEVSAHARLIRGWPGHDPWPMNRIEAWGVVCFGSPHRLYMREVRRRPVRTVISSQRERAGNVEREAE
jgi:hypothetical protein